MDFKKEIGKHVTMYSIQNGQNIAKDLVWLRNYPIIFLEQNRKPWMPITHNYKYPDVSDKFFYQYGEEEKNKFKLKLETDYPIKMENHFTSQELFDVCLNYLAQTAYYLLNYTSDYIKIAKIYKEHWIENSNFLIDQSPTNKKDFIKNYLNYLIDKVSEIQATNNNIKIGDILKNNGINDLKK